jgi:hypothetical protein
MNIFYAEILGKHWVVHFLENGVEKGHKTPSILPFLLGLQNCIRIQVFLFTNSINGVQVNTGNLQCFTQNRTTLLNTLRQRPGELWTRKQLFREI